MTINVRGGAFCSPEGASGNSSIGTPLVCASSDGGRARWRKQAGTTATNAGTDAGHRRGVLTKLRKLGIKVKRGTPIEELEGLLANPPVPEPEVEPVPEPVVDEAAQLEKDLDFSPSSVGPPIDPDKYAWSGYEDTADPADYELQQGKPAAVEPEQPAAPAATPVATPAPEPTRPPAEVAPAAPATPTAPPAPPAGRAPVTVTTGNPVTPRPENHWGADGKAEISYHWDGMIGRTVDHELGDAGRTIHVNGRPLGDHLEVLASRTVKGELHPQEQVTEIRRVAGALPEGREKRVLSNLANELDAPPVTVELPAGTPARLVKLADDLAKIPLARGAGYGEQYELDAIRTVAGRYARGETNGNGLIRELRQSAHNRRHESKEGKVFMDAVITKAVDELERTKREWRRPSS